MSGNTLNEIKYTLLKKYFGHDSFRQGQEPLIDNILSGKDVLGIMPTGAGKSVCYQLTALMLKGVTIVISPLISLMKDQVNSLIQNGIPAAYINSSLTPAQYSTVINRAKNGAYKIIYVAPERLETPSFKEFSRHAEISMICVDEAHCVSQWGQDFRPSYLNVKTFAQSLPERPIVSAFTATATSEVKDDIIKMLGLYSPFVTVTGFDRKNLYFGVKEPKDKFAETLRIVKEYGSDSGIIYCSTRKNTEAVCAYLNDNGIPCTRYHAGLDDEERRKNQDDFLYDRVRVMSATNAFGMGIDKSDVRFVIHFNMPKNLESYYQEAGRAGRDGGEAVCTLLFSKKDVQTNRFLIENSNENSDLDEDTREFLLNRDYERLSAMTRYCTSAECLRHYILKYFGEDSPKTCMKCSSCEHGYETADVTIEAQKIMSCIYRLAQRKLQMSTTTVIAILRGTKDKQITRFELTDLSTYGIMKDVSAAKTRAITDELCYRGYIRKGEYEVLILTAKAKGILSGEESFSMAFKKSVKSGRADSPTRKRQVGENPDLFERLRTLRSELARKENAPAYIIFSDSSLRSMCEILPTNESEFLTVSGVGELKTKKYGKAFTKLIAEYLSENPNASNPQTDGEIQLARRERAIKKHTPMPEPETPHKKPAQPYKPLQPRELAERIAGEKGIDGNECFSRLCGYILTEGYVKQSGEDFTVTPKGGVNGFALSTKKTENGLKTILELKKSAQNIIWQNLDDIL